MRKYDCTLWDYLKSPTSPKMADKVSIVCLVLDAVIYIQENNLVHLDVKPSNIMLAKDSNDQWDGKTVVLADFGLSTTFDRLKGNCGTPGYGSPEQFLGQPSKKSDNYAIGKLSVMTMFPWQSAWNFLAQPLKKGEISEVENSKLLSPFHEMISSLLNVSFQKLLKKFYQNLI